MAFCTNCGQRVADGEKFCANCGTPIAQRDPQPQTERKTVYDGEIHKCPRCGEVLKAFEMECPSCGFELRGTQNSNAVRDLAKKLEATVSEKQRIVIVKNFPIPNTKEDIFEFMILATSNFDEDYYNSHRMEEDLSDAWLVKIELCYKKAKLVLSKEDFEKIEKMYFEIKTKIYKSAKNKKIKIIISIALIALGLILVLTENTAVGAMGLVLMTVGIVRLVMHKKEQTTESVEKITVSKKGYASWSTGFKIFWIVLNIYTIGIPAIIYSCNKKKQ